MRRNRRKLHLELRLRAEAHQASLHQRRLLRLAARERTRAPVRPAPVRAPVGDGPVVGGADALLVLAGVREPLRRAVLRVARTVGRTLPSLFVVEQLPWWLLLAQQEWVRDPESFVPPGGSIRRKRDAFARHLLVAFPAPPFLLRALDTEPIAVARVPVEDEWAVALLSHLGRGLSLRNVVGDGLLPMPLTRRMCHLFVDAPAGTSPLLALRRAQVGAAGAPPTFASALMATRLGRFHGPDPKVGEPFWHGVLAWLSRRPALYGGTAAALDGLLGWIEAGNRDAVTHGTTFRFAARSDDAVLREAGVWRRTRPPPGRDPLPRSGLLPLDVDGWSFHELDSRSALRDEGQAMRHCVGLYTRLVEARKVAVWSLRWAGQRVVTVEVSLGAGQVVQAKRAANRAVTPEERGLIGRWAALNRLRVAF